MTKSSKPTFAPTATQGYVDLIRTTLAARKAWMIALVWLEGLGFSPTTETPEGFIEAKTDVLSLNNVDIGRWYSQVLVEAKLWIKTSQPVGASALEVERAIQALSSAASLETALSEVLVQGNREIINIVGTAASRALTVGLTLKELVGDSQAVAAQLELQRQRKGLSQGNTEKTARRMRWQKRVYDWYQAQPCSLRESNAALAVKFRASNPNSGAPNSAELDRFIAGLRRKRT